MSSDEDILFRALQVDDAAQRATLVQEACTNDPEQRARIESLIIGYERAAPLFQVRPLIARLQGREWMPQRIDRFKVIRPIGEGGVGVVYRAEQEEPVQRTVALKVIKPGMDSHEVIARFESESQALALMNHPHIARIFDAGATADGHPYFAMEFIDGSPVTRFADEHALNVEARLALFLQVCHAMGHAHDRGIVHRDIKPSNILVTMDDGVPTPKVIDFGIAKATQGKLTDSTIFTAFEQFIGTPAYMSPEQVEMRRAEIDPRSDIYSLGVLLYELLTGSPPFDPGSLATDGLDQLRRIIRETEPVRPSVRVATLSSEERTTVAKSRGLSPAQLHGRLRGDLDWIVMRCLEKDRLRRYETAHALALDLQRHLRQEPVIARPPNAGYVLQKLVRRHRIAFATAAVVFVALLAALGVSLWSLLQQRESLARAVAAEREQIRLRETAERAEAREAELRREAEAQELAARQRAYAADMKLLHSTLPSGNLGWALELLNHHRPQPGKSDLRGWEWRYLWQFCQGDAHAEIWHQPFPIKSMSVSADGMWIAVAGYPRGGPAVRNLRTGEEFKPPAGNGLVVAAFSPRHPVLAFGGTDSKADGSAGTHFLAIWNLDTKRIERRLELPGPCLSLNFSEDGDLLVTSTGSPDFTVTTWQMPAAEKIGSCFARQAAPFEARFSFAVSRDLELAVHHVRGHSIRVIDRRTGIERWTERAAGEWAAALAFSPDGRVLASGAAYAEGTIRLWDVATGKELGRLEGHQGFVNDLLFWPDGRTLASASGDQTVRLWDVPTRRHLRTLRGHAAVWQLERLPDDTLLSGDKDGRIHRWDFAAPPPPPPELTLRAEILAWRFEADSKSILALETDGSIAEWRGREFQERNAVMSIGAVARDVYIAQFSTDLPLLAVVQSGVVNVWDFERRQLLQSIRDVAGPVAPVCFVGQGRRLIVFTRNTRRYSEWELATGQALASWAGPREAREWGFCVSPDETTGLMIGFLGDTIVRNMHTGAAVHCDLGIEEIRWPRYSLDGRYFAVSSSRGLAKLWHSATRREAAVFSGFGSGIQSIAFSPDSRRIVTSSGGERAISMWDVEGHQHLLTLAGAGSLFRPTAFSPDGNILGSISQGTFRLHLWRAPSSEEIQAVEGMTGTSGAGEGGR